MFGIDLTLLYKRGRPQSKLSGVTASSLSFLTCFCVTVFEIHAKKFQTYGRENTILPKIAIQVIHGHTFWD